MPIRGQRDILISSTEDWKRLLNGSKRNLLNIAQGRADRIVHTGDWKSRLRSAISDGRGVGI